MLARLIFELIVDTIKWIFNAVKNIFSPNRRMTFLTTLHKDNYTIYIYDTQNDSYVIEYSDDGFGSKTRKTYESRQALLDMLERRFTYSELNTLCNKFAQLDGDVPDITTK